MKNMFRAITLILVAVASVYTATQVHNKTQDGCSGEWKRAINKENTRVTENRPGSPWQLLPVSRLIKVDL